MNKGVHPGRECKEKAFTLAELLIVMLIISILITILLPTLSSVRRAGAAVKCLASLRQLGSAFQQYAQDNHRVFPVVRWYPDAGTLSYETTGPHHNNTDRIWVDFLSRYVGRQATAGDVDIYGGFQNASVFWGCPSFDTTIWDGTGATDRMYSMGYGMSLYAMGPYRDLLHTTPEYTPTAVGGPATAVWNYAWVTPGKSGISGGSYPNKGKGNWIKMEVWGRHSQDKGLLADSNGYDLICSQTWLTANDTATPPTVMTEPASMGLDRMTFAYGTTLTPNGIAVDVLRHVKPSADKHKVLNQRGVNMLFVDGHAAPVTAHEAWIATYGGGRDMTQ